MKVLPMLALTAFCNLIAQPVRQLSASEFRDLAKQCLPGYPTIHVACHCQGGIRVWFYARGLSVGIGLMQINTPHHPCARGDICV